MSLPPCPYLPLAGPDSQYLTALYLTALYLTALYLTVPDCSVSVWDASVERDECTAEVEEEFGLGDLPPQLLFLHQGQKEVCEAMWHPLLPSVAITVDAQGFNIWKAENL